MEPRERNIDLKDAPTLRSIPKVDPFVVPEGFFDRFPQKVQEKIAAGGGKVINLNERRAQQRLYFRIAAAAAMVALVATLALNFLQTDDTAVDGAMAQITVTPSELDLDALDDHDLFALLGSDDEPFAQPADGLSSEEMAAYLEHEELPLDLLIEEL